MDDTTAHHAATLADTVRKARGTATKADLARRAGLGVQWLGHIERAQIADPSPRRLRRLATALGVEYLDLMHAAGYLAAGDEAEADNMLYTLRRIWLAEPPTGQEVSAFGTSGAGTDGQAIAFGALRRLDPALKGSRARSNDEAREEFRRWYLGEPTT